LDLAGPYNIYVLLYTLTKWIELIPIRDKCLETVADALTMNVFKRHGAPETLISDNGSEFSNLLMESVCYLIGFKKRIFITPRNPRSDGMVERQVGNTQGEQALIKLPAP
jgi:transposase InsO family protein